ncbi:MAG: hypothetical protein ACK4SA_01640 [Caldilinea sp.]
MKRWLAFLLAAGIFLAVHEGLHALTAILYGEYRMFHIRPIGFEVEFRTPVEEREGVHWAVMSGTSNLVTVLIGYLLLGFGAKFTRLDNAFLKGVLFYATIIFLLADPLNLSIGPFLYGGDANGIAGGLGVNRLMIQVIFLAVFMLNRELIARRVLPTYYVQSDHIFFRPLKGKEAT